jgi:hypothetical protein
MGATYLSLQLRTTNRDAAVECLESVAAANAGEGEGLQFYVADPIGHWLAVFPNRSGDRDGLETRSEPLFVPT